jgi:hypothetical protein
MLDVGRLLILLGLIIVMVGLLTWSGVLDWFGRLPGDLRSERPGFRFFLPLTSLLVASAVFNLLILVVRRLLF